jgi:hypothetical protein
MRLNPALVRRTRHAVAYDTFIGRIDRHPPALRMAVLELRRRLHVLSKRYAQDLDPTQIDTLCATVQRIASEADAAGLTAHRSLAVRMIEQLDPMRSDGYMPARIVQVMYEWSGLLLACLVRPYDMRDAARLVRLFGDSRWQHPLSSAEREELLAALLVEAAVGQI